MESILGFFSMFLILAALIVYPLYFRSLGSLLRLMEVKFVDEWTDIGRPKIDSSISMRNSLAAVRFIWSGRYKDLKNDDAVKLGRRTHVLLALGIVIVFTLIILGYLGSSL